MRNLWTENETEPLLWAAMLIAEGRMSYYRACKTLDGLLPLRSFESIRTKLKPMVAKIKAGTKLAADKAPFYRPHVYVAKGFTTNAAADVVKNFIAPAALSLATTEATMLANGWTKDQSGHWTSALLCEHANECPVECPCAADCYCKAPGHACGKKIEQKQA